MLDTRSSPEKNSPPAGGGSNKGPSKGLVVFLVIVTAAVVAGLGFLLYRNYTAAPQGNVAANDLPAPVHVGPSASVGPVDPAANFTPDSGSPSAPSVVSSGASTWNPGTSYLDRISSEQARQSASNSGKDGDPLCYEPSETANYLNGISALILKKKLDQRLIAQYHVDPAYYNNVMSSGFNGLGMGVPYVAYVHEASFDPDNRTVEATIDSIRYLIRFAIDSKDNIVRLEIAGRA